MPDSSKHANDVTFTEESLIAFIKKIKTDIDDNKFQITAGDAPGQVKYKYKKDSTYTNLYVKGFANNKFDNRNGQNGASADGYIYTNHIGASGNAVSDAYINNLYGTNVGASGTPFTNGYITNLNGNGNIGSSGTPYANGYITNLYGTNLGSSGSPWTNAYIKNLTIASGGTISGTPSFSGALTITDTTEAKRFKTAGTGSPYYETDVTASQVGTIAGSIVTYGGIAAKMNIMGYKVLGAVFNDYAEYRQANKVRPGRCVIEVGDGNMILSTERLQPGANIVSDTFGFAIGETPLAQVPIAVCGRVLAYPFEDKEIYEPGDAVCSGPDGTISKMTREEIKEWPDRIVGYVSEIPTYEYWGSDKVEVNGRIWIKIK